MNQSFEKEKSPEETHDPVNKSTNIDQQVDHDRRLAVRKIAVASAALTCCSLFPEKWSTPFIEFGTLPAHATTSGVLAEIIDELGLEPSSETETNVTSDSVDASTEAEVEAEAEAEVEEMYGYNNKEQGVHEGQIHIDGNYPERFVWSKDGPDYGSNILIVAEDAAGNQQQLYVPDTSESYVIGTGNRKYVAGYPYFVSGNSSQPHQTMEYYADYSTSPNKAWVYYG